MTHCLCQSLTACFRSYKLCRIYSTQLEIVVTLRDDVM